MFKLKDKKDSGEVLSNFGPIVLSALVALVLIIIFSGWVSNYEKRDNVNQIARKYILRMETTGGLTSEDELNLKDDLSHYCTNIDLDPEGHRTTRYGEVGYGESVDLYIAADIYTYEFAFKSSKNHEAEEGTIFQLDNVDGRTTTEGHNRVVDGTDHTTHFILHRSSTSKN